MAKILIAGGTGLVGSRLSELLSAGGHEIAHLSRFVAPGAKFPTYKWDIDQGFIDKKAFDGAGCLIHLAGAGVADRRWTNARKNLIMSSRVKGTELLYRHVKDLNIPIKHFISASAIGYYGAGTGIQTEESPAGSGFLAGVVVKWEAAADLFAGLCPVAKIRIGVVLSNKGGAMTEILKPIRMYAGASIGKGDQLTSWIHLEDLCRIFEHAISHALTGAFNAVAPNPVTNRRLTKVLAEAVGKPIVLPNVPAFMMKLMLGQMAQIILEGCYVSSRKIERAGFKFHFEKVEDAVNDLIK